MTSAGEYPACSDGAVKGDWKQDLTSREPDYDVLGVTILADSKVIAEDMGEILSQFSCFRFIQVIARVRAINVNLGLFLG